MDDMKIISEACDIVDSLIQNRTLRYHERITDWKYDLAMEGYTLWLEEDRAMDLEVAIKKVYSDKVNAQRQRGKKRSHPIVLPFSSVPERVIENGISLPETSSNLEQYDSWQKKYTQIKHLFSEGEDDLICMLMDGLTISEICKIVGISDATVYRAVKTIKSKIERWENGKD